MRKGACRNILELLWMEMADGPKNVVCHAQQDIKLEQRLLEKLLNIVAKLG